MGSNRHEARRWSASPCAGLALAWLGLLCASHAHAEVKEPNGVSVPLASTGGEVQLSTLFMMRPGDETIDFVADGLPTPDTFSPLCGFKATLVLKQSGSTLAVGWYNADPARTTAPAASELHEIVPAGSAVGTSIVASDIRNDPAYAGGPIGFALIRTPPSFTEARYNTVCSLCTTPAPWILSVSYKSKAAPNTYYVAFEDGDTSAITWSNDGDFNDYVFRFEGLSCVGEGASCDVPDAKGTCVPGILECSAGGALVCTAVNAKMAEVCDGQDNDCNGQIDEGDALCGSQKVCSRGQCVPRCGTGEFLCATEPFTQCENGLCVDPACAGKTCAAGQACIRGKCLAPCDGVVCPGTQTCRLGQCVDPCVGVSCDADHVCSGGGCILRCDCGGCPSGQSCDSSGLCIEQSCAGKACAAGSLCKSGQCVDACQGASCPTGTRCDKGACVATANADVGSSTPGTDGGSSRDGSILVPAAGAGASAADGGASTGAGGAAGTGATGTRRTSAAASGCGCRIAAARRHAHTELLAVCGLALGWLGARRQRRRS